ncbi:oxidoreductase [Colwellia sp. 39_35_sub15_T18]|nr:oxidoreductase [Colwellia sp. 39_35_sub15_T18]
MSSNNAAQFCNLPNAMKAIVLEQPNEQIQLAEIELSLPQCNDNEILVKVASVGLNPLDAQFAKTGFGQWQYPHILGLDAVGTVAQASQGLFPRVGDRIMWHSSLTQQGVLSEYAKVPNFAVSVIPDSVSSNTAASILSAGMSALIALEKIKITEGDSVFIDSGAGAVGQFAIQFAKQRGADVFATASKHNHKLIKKLGADAVFDYQDKKLCEKIRTTLGPQGFDAVVDSIGGETTVRNIELMRFCGRIACLKSLPALAPELMYRKAPNISVVSLGGAWLSNNLCAQQHMSFMSKLLLENVASGEVCVPEIAMVNFSAQDISMALRKQVSGGFTGKQVVEIS